MTAGKAASPFVVMVKPAGSRCNLRCGYCYYLGTDEKLQHTPEPRMSDETLEALIRGYIEAAPGPVVSFTWHGGEPTLAELDFYRRAVELQKQYLTEGMQCWNSLQTNGILLDEEWCRFLGENHFDVGLSLDGDAENHDLMRLDAAGEKTYERIVGAVSRLQKYGVQPDLLCTVTSYAAERPLEIYRALRELRTGWIQFIPIVRRENGALTQDSVTAEGYGRFLCRIFDEWVRHDIGRIDVQLFAETSAVLNGGEASLCTMRQTCGRALIVERDGGVYSCDHFVDPEHCLGTLSDGLGVLVETPEQAAFGEAKHASLPKKCQECPYLACCGGGCPKDRFGPEGEDVLCEGFRKFFAHASSRLKRYGELRRKNLPPQAIQQQMTADWATAWEGVGRNDPCPCGSGLKAKKCCWDLRP